MQGLRETIPAMAQMKQQRELNRLKKANQLAELQKKQRTIAQQNQLRQHLRQSQQDVAEAQQGVQGRNLFRALSYGQTGEEGPTAQMNQLAAPLSDQIEAEPEDFSPIRAELEFWKARDPQRYREIMGNQIDKVTNLAEQDPAVAERYAEEALGMPMEIRGNELTFRTPEGIKLTGDPAALRAYKDFTNQNPNASKDQILNKAMELGVELQFPQQQDIDQREREIQDLLAMPTVKTREEAVKIADGLYELKETPFGTELWDMTTQTRIRSAQQARETDEDAQETGITDAQKEIADTASLQDVKDVYGPVSTLKQTVNDVLGWAVPGQIFPGTQEARDKVHALNQTLLPLLMVSERGAKWDKERVENLLFRPQIFRDPDAVRDKVQSLQTQVQATIDTKRRILQEQRLTKEMRAQLSDDIQKLTTLQEMLPRAEELTQERQQATDLTVQDIQSMGVEELQNTDIDSLNQAQRRAMLNRIEQLEQEGQ